MENVKEPSDPPVKKLLKMEKSEKYNFPDTLKGLGYKFKDGEYLVNIKTNKPFEFDVSEDDTYNQKHYEALGEVITQEVYKLLETKLKLKKMHIPIDAKDDEATTFIFVSDKALNDCEKLLVLVHGNGVVRAGQWARRLIINDCISSGTQIPFIRQALKENYGVVVLNTNDNLVHHKGKKVPVRESEKPEKHMQYVWEHVILKSKAKHVAIIAHSYGGVCTVELAKKNFLEMQQRVFAIALTDSVHSVELQGVPPPTINWLQKVSRNWASSQLEVDTPIIRHRLNEIPQVSAGVLKHEMTSWASMNSIFKFLDERYRTLSENPPSKKKTEL